MQFHDLQPNTKAKKAKRVGRGGKRGKTSGRGHKGQKARAGNSSRPEMREIIKKLPKLRGHGKNRARTVHGERTLPVVVNVSKLEVSFDNNGEVNPKVLVAKGVVKKDGGKTPKVKILGSGELTKSLKVSGCYVTEGARSKIEGAKGTIS